MRKLIILIFLFILQDTYCQDFSPTSKNEIDNLLTIAKNGQYSPNLELVYNTSKIALDKSIKFKYSEGIARAHYYIALTLSEKGNYKSALEHLTISSKENYTKETPQLTTDIHRVRARVYGSMGLTDLSIAELKKGLNSSKKIPILQNRKYTQSLFYENLIFLHKKKQELDSVKFFIDKNRIVIEGLSEDFIFRNKINYYNDLAEHYLAKKEYDCTMQNLEKAIELSEKYTYPYTSVTYKLWGDLYSEKKNIDTALLYYFKAIENIEQTGLKNEAILIYDKISSLYEKQGNKDSAQNYYIKAMELRQKLAAQKLNATESAFNIVVDQKSTEISKSNDVLIFSLITFFVITLVLLIVYFYKKQQKAKKRILINRNLLKEKESIIQLKEQETQELRQRVNESFDEIIDLAKQNHPEFLTRFSEVYPQFYQILTAMQPKLLTAEIRFCALLYLNFTTKDIAEYTFVTVKAVQHRKFRLRKKLNIPSDTDILNWLNKQ